MARKAGAAKGKGRGVLWLQLLACGGCAAVAPQASAMLAVLLSPAIIALLVDRTPSRPVGRAMLLCGSAACVGPLIDFWRTGNGGFAVLGDPGIFGPAWIACAGGWLLSQLLPVGIGSILEAASHARTARLRAERERLVREWGLED